VLKLKMGQLSGKKNKKAQLTVFFILGIILIAAVAYYLSSRGKVETVEVSADIQPVKLYLDKCLELASKNAFIVMGINGGKRILEEPYLSSGIVDTNFLYDGGTLRIDSLDVFKKNLEAEISSNLEKCFSNFSEPGTAIERGIPNVTVNFLEKSSRIDAVWPVKVQRNGKTEELGRLESATLDVRMKLIYEVAANITDNVATRPEKLEFLPLLETGMNITIGITPDAELFLIIDPNSTIEHKPYAFFFATRIK